MGRAALLLLLALPGCTTSVVFEAGPPLSTSGVTLYLIDASEDWMDDVSIDLVNRDPNRANAWYLGSQALELTLYAAARGKHARIVESEHFEMGNGVLSQIEASGFELSVMPLLSADEKYVTAVYSLRQKGEGPEAESRWLESGQRTVPVGGSLGFGFPGAPSRKKVLLLHFASVGPEKP